MRKTLLLTSSAILIAAMSTASAADLSKPVYTKAPPPPPPPCTWCGFYIGINAGGKWADIDHNINDGLVTFTGNSNSSWIAGGQLGYNWQFGQWVIGVEGDVDAQDFSRDRVIVTPIGPFIAGDTFHVESKWQASLRGRIGYAAWDRALL